MSNTKKIGGRIFTKYYTFSKKSLAKESAQNLRKLGNLVRVIKEKGGYTVYSKGVKVSETSKRMKSMMYR